jgi:hypothetical protein
MRGFTNRLLPGVRLMLGAAVLAAVGCGCNLFALRDPEPPSNTGTVRYELPSAPDQVLRNLKYSADALSAVNFDRDFGEDYRFRFDPLELVGEDTILTRDQDIAKLTALFQGKGKATLEWISIPGIQGTSTDPFYRDLNYRLRIRVGASDTSRTVVIRGKCNLYMHIENQCKITRWEDLQAFGDSLTWGWARRNTSLPR